MEKLQEAQTKKMDMMTKIYGWAMLEILDTIDMNIVTLSGFDNSRTERK